MITANGRFDDEFLRIVYADEALLRAEFDDLVASQLTPGHHQPP